MPYPPVGRGSCVVEPRCGKRAGAEASSDGRRESGELLYVTQYTWVFNTGFLGPAGNRRFSRSGRPRGAPKTIQKYGGASHPIFLNGFLGPRGRPDTENRFLRISVKPDGWPDCVLWAAALAQCLTTRSDLLPVDGKAKGWLYGVSVLDRVWFQIVFWFHIVFVCFETGSDWFLGAQAPPRTNLNRFRSKNKI
jgi:hypothetical protein